MRAEFEEKQYEMQACIELAAGRAAGHVYSSGQILESILGYDAAAHPGGNHLIWKVLNAPRPAGVVLLPQFWLPGRTALREALPTAPVSLILQFKRAERMIRPGTAQWDLWGKPYFRFQRTEHQHRILKRLEQSLGERALVRYAAPSFHTRGELDSAQIRGEVLGLSGFVSPAALKSHRVWTYLGPGIDGRGNPHGSVVPFESFREVLVRLRPLEAPSRESRMEGSLSSMAAAVEHRNPGTREPVAAWIAGLASAGAVLSYEQRHALRAYAAVQSEVARAGAHWWVVDGAA